MLALVYLAAMAIAFRPVLASGLDLGFSDRGDGLIEISLLEHWRNVLLGHAQWNQPYYFHPYGGTLGYNDGYLLFGLVYSFWRQFFDPFWSDTLNILTFRTIGFFAAYAMVARVLGWGRPVALMVALLFAISNNLFVRSGHAQLQTIALLPVVMMLVTTAFRAEIAGRRGRARVLAVGAAAVMAAWFSTALYLAWFTLFFALVLALCWLVVSGNWRPARLAALARAHLATLAIGGGALVVLLVPFLSVYLPKAAETGGHGYWRMLGYLVTPFDLINVGQGNLAWGWLPQLVRMLIAAVAPVDAAAIERAVGGEHETGFPLLLFGLAIAAGLTAMRRHDRVTGAPNPLALRAFALAVFVSWALTLQLWIFSPWGLVYAVVPGARALRVVLRYQIFVVLPLLLLVFAVYRARAMQLMQAKPLLAGALVLLLVAEQINFADVAQLSRSRQIAALHAIPTPPRDCRSFYIVQSRRDEPLFINAKMNAVYPHNIDAMYLAERWRVPTVIGFSTFTPPDWNFRDPLAPDFDARVATYARAHRLDGLCRLDVRESRPWRLVTVSAP